MKRHDKTSSIPDTLNYITKQHFLQISIGIPKYCNIAFPTLSVFIHFKVVIIKAKILKEQYTFEAAEAFKLSEK
jgi:hypothetical protein